MWQETLKFSKMGNHLVHSPVNGQLHLANRVYIPKLTVWFSPAGGKPKKDETEQKTAADNKGKVW